MFDPLNKTVPPGIFSAGDNGENVTYIKKTIEGVYSTLIYDSNQPTFFGRTFPSFMTPDQKHVFPYPRYGLGVKLKIVSYMQGGLLETIRANDAKLNPFTYPSAIVGDDEGDYFPPGERNYFGTTVLTRSDITVKGIWDNPVVVPPGQGGGGSERPDSGLLYPRKV